MKMNKPTEEQLKIINSEDKHILCVANAGTGKTFTLVHRVERLLSKGIKPKNILLTSFSRSANSELQSRIVEKVGERGNDIDVCTIHSFCYRLIRENMNLIDYSQIEVVPEPYYAAIVLNMSAQMGRVMKKKDARSLANMFQRAKMAKTTDQMNLQDKSLFNRVEANMKMGGKITFNDILVIANDLLDKEEVKKQYNYFEHIMLDELQDTSYIQFEIVEKILNEDINLFLVGDAKQQIYGFRGCSYKFMDAFARKVSATVYYLTETFRFGQKIAKLANVATEALEGLEDIYKSPTVTKVAVDNKIDFKFLGIGPSAKDIAEDVEYKNTEGTPYKEMFVLYRFNKDSIFVQKTLSEAGIPYITKSGSFLNRLEIKFLINTCSLVREFDLSLMLDLLKKYNNQVNSVILNRAYQSAVNKKDVLSVLESGHVNYIEGVGDVRKKAFEDLYFKFVEVKNLINKNADELFVKIARAMNIDEADFMSDNVDSTSGENNYLERWEFIDNFQDYYAGYTQKNSPDVYAFLDKMKVDFADSDENNKNKNAVTLMTIHGSKGMTLPYVYLLGHNIANPAFFKQDTPAEDILGEKFLLYVALTRVSKDLVFYYPDPSSFMFNYIFPTEIVDESNKKKEKGLLSENQMNLFVSNYDRLTYTPLNGYSIIGESSSGLAVGFVKGSKKVWVSQKYLGYDCGTYYLPKWMARKNNVV
jgi:DNA helicase-2/ATP-dependent DNA helicase PcrA